MAANFPGHAVEGVGVNLTVRFLPSLNVGRFVALEARRSERLWLLGDQVGRAQTSCVAGPQIPQNPRFCAFPRHLPRSRSLGFAQQQL